MENFAERVISFNKNFSQHLLRKWIALPESIAFFFRTANPLPTQIVLREKIEAKQRIHYHRQRGWVLKLN